MKLKYLLLLLPILLDSGCAYMSSHTRTPIFNGTNIVAYATTDARGTTLFDSQNQLVKFRNSNGGPTNSYSSGTVIGSVNESSSASNIVAVLNAAAAIASKVP